LKLAKAFNLKGKSKNKRAINTLNLKN